MSTHYDSQFDDWADERDYLDSEMDEREDEEWGCIFGVRCCMTGEHTTDECHTPEMAAEAMRESQ